MWYINIWYIFLWMYDTIDIYILILQIGISPWSIQSLSSFNQDAALIFQPSQLVLRGADDGCFGAGWSRKQQNWRFHQEKHGKNMGNCGKTWRILAKSWCLGDLVSFLTGDWVEWIRSMKPGCNGDWWLNAVFFASPWNLSWAAQRLEEKIWPSGYLSYKNTHTSMYRTRR